MAPAAMAFRETTLANPPRDPGIHSIRHIEIVSTERAKLRQFLEKQFGWKFETHKMPAGDYNAFRTPDGTGGGVMSPMPSQPIAATPYINVADVEATMKSCQKAGATIMMPVTEVPGRGKFFWLRVASGPPLACCQQTGPRNRAGSR